MKRNKYGINFDPGIPLSTDQDFKILYLDIVPEKKQRLIDWMENDYADPVIIAGQIGTGKTTFISKAFIEANKKTDITISFDTEIPFSNGGAFWSIFLGKIFAYAQNLDIDLAPFKIETIFSDKKQIHLKELIELLCCPVSSIALYNNKKKLFIKADNNIDAIQHTAKTLIHLIEENQTRPVSFFAEGIDKFSVYRPDYFSLLPLLNFLGRYKTLYEANLVHMVGVSDEWLQKSSKIVINNISIQNILDILEKRMGVYAKARQEIFPLISGLSGGNMRQGLRLLMEYDYAAGRLKKNRLESIHYASQRVRNDFLNIPAGRVNPDLLSTVDRDKFLKGGVVAGFSEGEDARLAIYSNWILITDEPDSNQNWPAAINPLILSGLSLVKKIPDSLEIQLIKNWAEQHEISPFGLEIDLSEYGATENTAHNSTSRHNGTFDHSAKFFSEISRLQYNYDALNISDIFDGMASFIINNERRDKIIIAYKKKELVELANDYIVGRAGRHKPVRFNEISLNTGVSKNFLMTIIENLDDSRFDAYSIFFDDRLNKDQIILFEKNRDYFMEYKMVWWVEDDLLRKYLPYWTQLRQFFYIFRLEQDILGSISSTQIKQDLDILQHSQSEGGSEVHISKLKTVLKYLEKRK